MTIEEIKREAANVMRNKYSIWGRNVADIPLYCMVVDSDAYQRKESHTVKKIAQNFDPNKVGFLQVSYRDGLFHVIDGQHRLAAAKILEIESLPCIIYVGLTIEDEALIFARQQDNVSKLTLFDIYTANICNGNESIPEVKTDMLIRDICGTYDIPVVNNQGYGLTNIRDARDIVKKNPQMFDWMMNLLHDSDYLLKNRNIGYKILRALKRCYDYATDLGITYNFVCNIFKNYETNDIQTAARVKYPALESKNAFVCFLGDLVTGDAVEEDITRLAQAS